MKVIGPKAGLSLTPVHNVFDIIVFLSDILTRLIDGTKYLSNKQNKKYKCEHSSKWLLIYLNLWLGNKWSSLTTMLGYLQ